MAKNFRKLRMTNLSQNRFGKYLVYALGEILLVVIGILIAFRIDSWKTQQLRDKKLQSIYHAIVADMKLDQSRALEIESSLLEKDSICDYVLEGNLNEQTFLENSREFLFPVWEFHTFLPQMNGYLNLTENLDQLPPETDSLVRDLHIHYRFVEKSSLDYEKALKDFSYHIHEKWAEEYPWFWAMQRNGDIDDECIEYFINSDEYRGILSQFKSKGWHARIPLARIRENTPDLIKRLETLQQ